MSDIGPKALRLASSLEAEGRPEDAIQVHIDAFNANPRCTVSLYQASRIMRKLGRLRDACTLVDEAVRVGADEGQVFRQLRADDYALTGQYRKTVEEYDALDRLGEGHYPSNSLAYSLVKMNRSAEGLAEIRSHIHINEDAGSDEWHTLGYAYLANGDLRRAKRCFRITLKLEPEHNEAWFHLGLAHLKEGNRADAECILQHLKTADIAWAGMLCMHMYPEENSTKASRSRTQDY